MSNIHGLNTDDDKPPRSGDGGSSGNESDDEGRQGFFVGGSERSGQQVLGPNQNDRQNRIFNAIRQAGAEQMTPEQMNEMERQKQQRDKTSAWSGGGFRLGGHGIASEQVGSSSRPSVGNAVTQRQQQVVRMFMWQNGFSIDDGPLRQFQDPQNRAFMAALMNKRIPPELNLLYPGKEIDLRIERKAEDYVPPKAKPFSGQGHRLGSHVPNVVGAGTSITNNVDVVDLEPVEPLKAPSESLVEKAQKDVKLDDKQPITRVQIRFPDLPQPIVARFNHTATTELIRTFIVTVQPGLAYRPFQLQTIYPRKLIEDEKQSLEEAKLLNAAITLKFDE